MSHLMCYAIASPVSPPILGYNEPTIASLIGQDAQHDQQVCAFRRCRVAGAADVVANAIMKLMGLDLASDQAQPQLREQSRD